jgi:hypothetical protein
VSFGAADLTDYDPRRLQSHTCTEAFQHRHAANSTEVEIILDRALELGSILDRNHPIVGCQPSQSIQARVYKRRFAASGRAHNEDILFRTHRRADDLGVLQAAHFVKKIILTPDVIQGIAFSGQDASSFVLVELKDPAWSQANGEDRVPHYRRDDSFKAAPIDRQFGFQDGVVVIQDGTAPSRYGAQGTRSLRRRDFAGSGETFTHSLDPEKTVRIQKDVFGAVVA